MQIEQLLHIQSKLETASTTKKQQNLKNGKGDFAWILTLERKWKTQG